MKNNQKDAVRGVEQDIRWVKSTMTKYANELLDKLDSCESTIGWYMETFTDTTKDTIDTTKDALKTLDKMDDHEMTLITARANIVKQLRELNEAITVYIDSICNTLPEVKEIYDERQSIRCE